MNLALFDMEEPPATEGRDELDRYYTPEWATQALVDYLGGRLRGDVWDPCCGKDWGGRVIRKCPDVKHFYGSDIDPEATCGRWRNGEPLMSDFALPTNFLEAKPTWGATSNSQNWTITNPPYLVGDLTAADFARHALAGRSSVAMLLSLRWLEACKDRADLLLETPPTDVLVLGRVQFIGSANGNMLPSVWMIWDKSREGKPSTIKWHRGSK